MIELLEVPEPYQIEFLQDGEKNIILRRDGEIVFVSRDGQVERILEIIEQIEARR